MRELSGIPAAPGYAVGPVHQMRRRVVAVVRRTIPARAVAAERRRFEQAVASAREELTLLRDKLQRELGNDEAGIMDSQLLMLEDELIWDTTLSRIRTQLVNAEAAFAHSIGQIVLQFDGMQEGGLRERIADLRDLEDRVLRLLQGEDAEQVASLCAALAADVERLLA